MTNSLSEERIQDQVSYLEHQSTFIHNYIGRADAKAAWIFAASGALSIYDLALFEKVADGDRPWLSIIVAVALGLFLFSSVKCFQAIFPRTDADPSGLRYFGSVANLTSAEEFSSKVSELSLSELRDEISRHNFEAAKICKSKFELVSAAGVLAIAAALLSGVAFVVSGS